MSSIASTTFIDNDFPQLSVDNLKKHSVIKSTPIVISGSGYKPIASTKRIKTVICKSVKNGVPCEYGNRCTFAHYFDELSIKDCNYQDKCIHARSLSSPCIFMHPSDTEKTYLTRLGVKDGVMMTRQVFNNNYTRMCISVYDGVVCDKIDECTFAHNKEQLISRPCNFGSKCYHVIMDENGYYTNKTQDKNCMFIHDGETFENYENRFLKPCALMSKEKMIKEAEATIESSQPNLVDVKEVQDSEENVEDNKIIVSVPSNLAVEMLEVLLKTGKNNIVLKTY